MTKRTPDSYNFYEERREHHREMRESLPSLKKLEYPTERPEVDIGVPAKELLKLRSSQQLEDRLFIETLRIKIKERLKKEVSEEELQKLENLRKLAEKERKNIEYVTFTFLAFEQGLKDSDWGVRLTTVKSLSALAPIKPELTARLYEQCLKDNDWAVRLGTAESLSSLVPINPELASQLYKQGLEDSDWSVRLGTVKSLSTLAPINPELAAQLYKKGLKDIDWGVRLATAESLSTLAPIKPELYTKIYEQGLKDTDWEVRSVIAKSLSALAPINPELTGQLYKQGLENSDLAVRLGTAKSLSALAPINPELYVELYKKSLEDKDPEVRRTTAKSLSALAPINPELYVELYKKSLEDKDPEVRRATAKSLSALAPINPELYVELYKKSLEDKDPEVRRATAKSLSALAPINPELASQLYKKSLEDKDPEVRRTTAESLSALAPINPELAAQLYKKSLEDKDPEVRRTTAESLSALAPINPELAAQLYKQGLENSDFGVRRATAKSLSALAPINPELAAQLYKQGLENSDFGVGRATAKSLSALAPINPELYVELYKKSLEDKDPEVRRATAESLSALAPINPELYVELYKKSLEDNEPSVRRATTESLSALAPINPEFYVELYKKSLEDKDPEVRRATTESLSALAPINPELYTKLYEQGLKDIDPEVRRATAKSFSTFIKNIDFSKLAFIEPILQKHQISEDEKIFVYARINQLLHRNKDLGNIILNDIPSLRVVKEYARTINPQLPENKQTINPDAFFEQNQIRLAKLFEIDRDLAQKMIIQKIQQLGFPRLERTLTLVDTLSSDSISAISLLIKRTPEKDSVYLEKLLELSDAYHRMGLESKFLEITKAFYQKESLTSKNIIQEISSELLKEFSKKIGIESKITPEAINQWNLEYLSKLFFAEKNFEEESRDLLKIIVKTTLQGDFQPIILNQEFDRSRYTKDELEIIDEIQKHNQKVKKAFQDAGIDYDTWLSYLKTQEFNVGVSPQEQENRFRSFTKELSEVITNLLGSSKEGKPGILPKETAKDLWKRVFKKYGIKFQEGELVTDKGKLSPLDLQNPLEEIIKFLEKEMESNPQEALGTSLDHLKNLLKLLPDLQKETKQKGYQFQIKLWDRQPGYDIFQGNYTHCCIALENFNRAAILDYLVDTGINIIEVKDINTNQTIAQTFILMGENQEKEIIAILDNIEINNDYRGLTDKIRQQLFTYISNFVDVLVKDPNKKINTVLLGTAYNDVETNDLPTRTEVVRKIGGPGILGTQYLDSFGSAWVDPSQFTSKKFFVALDNLRSKEKSIEKPKLKRGGNIEIISQLDKSILQDILSVEKASFPDQMQSNLEDLRETLENPNGIQIVVRSQEGKVIGYLSSKPQKEAYEELKNWDPEIDQEDQTLYVESIAIEPEARDLQTFLKLGRAFIEEAKKRGYKKITMHARVASGLSSILQKRYGAKALRKIENWHDFDEPFEYLEIDLSE